MIASLWANSNYDDEKGTRSKAISDIEAQFQEAVATVRTTGHEEPQIDEDNPFLEAATRGVAKIIKPRNDEGTVGEVIATEEHGSRYESLDQS